MAEMAYQWPRNSWAILTKIIRAWYSVETGGGEVTQKKIAEVAGVQQSQVSTNKAFLQAISILSSEGLSLTEGGKRLGLGIYSDNENMKRQGFEQVIKSTPILKSMLDIVRGRGALKVDDFYAEVALQMGGKSEGFTTGTAILIEILTLSGAVKIADNTLRPLRSSDTTEQIQEVERERNSIPNKPGTAGLNRIPIAVSTNSVWYIERRETNAGRGPCSYDT